MPNQLSSTGTVEKNKLFTDTAWITLVEIDFTKFGLDKIYICNNNEDIEWNSITWSAFPFDIELHGMSSKGNIPSLRMKVSNVNRLLQSYLEQTNGAIGGKVNIYVVNSKNFGTSYYDMKVNYEIIATESDNYYVYFTLSIPNLFIFKFPSIVFMKNFCRWAFKSPMCGYSGGDTSCNHTFADCEAKGNYVRFGGFPALHGGLWK